MKLSVSNIAWQQDIDPAMYPVLREHGYDGLDIAPGRVFADPYCVTDDEIVAFKKVIEAESLSLGGMQSLLFGRPDLTIFDSGEKRGETLAALKTMIDLAARLGLRALVFGSPKNRLIGEVTNEKLEVARAFFGTLGRYAHERGVVFTLEANPAIYGGDWLLTTLETIDFIRSVGEPGLKLNLDTGTIIENDELAAVVKLLEEDIGIIGHAHLSLPHLKPLVLTETHRQVIELLQAQHYNSWVAIEMVTDFVRPAEFEPLLETVRQLIDEPVT